jgi:3-phosphoshikimate 1-carboxyvinyltransferase
MSMQLRYNANTNSQEVAITLPGSKSISNRFLVLRALTGNNTILKDLSESRDTQLLQAALEKESETYWFEDGATPLRFFLAYAAVTGRTGLLDGISGLRSRTIAPLVEALEQAGASITFTQSPGFAPVLVAEKTTHSSHITVDRSASSQFVSALLLVAPKLSQKFHLQLRGNPSSDPYIQMTLKCMAEFGSINKYNPESNAILVDSSNFHSPELIQIEPDWSAASYFYALCACIPYSSFLFPKLKASGMQGDEKLQYFYQSLGVVTETTSAGLRIQNSGKVETSSGFDLKDQIDLAPAIICTCAYLRLEANFTGLENLKLKESDRLRSLEHNLNQFGCGILVTGNSWKLHYQTPEKKNNPVFIKTFSDHRIAMAFSIFALSNTLEIDDAECVVKSFPGYWNELAKCNFVHHDLGKQHTR